MDWKGTLSLSLSLQMTLLRRGHSFLIPKLDAPPYKTRHNGLSAVADSTKDPLRYKADKVGTKVF